jgi:hypothetical protein
MTLELVGDDLTICICNMEQPQKGMQREGVLNRVAVTNINRFLHYTTYHPVNIL